MRGSKKAKVMLMIWHHQTHDEEERNEPFTFSILDTMVLHMQTHPSPLPLLFLLPRAAYFSITHLLCLYPFLLLIHSKKNNYNDDY
jgi:hypothetical protein